MQIIFNKYQGEGNDFILLDNRKGDYNSINRKQIAQLCDRRFGIGADGLMLLEEHVKYDFTMRYFNADGREASMCGNGGRCIVAFACAIGTVKDSQNILFEAVDGLHHAQLIKENTVALQMKDVSEITKDGEAYILDTGSPHYVTFIAPTENFDTKTEGEKIRYNPTYRQEGINVNFVSCLDPTTLTVLTYERGVEDETLACGTGCVASALAFAKHSNSSHSTFYLYVKGGKLKVSFTPNPEGKGYTNIILEGGAKQVFSGQMEL